MDAARSVLIGLTLLFVHAPPGAHLQPLAEYHSTSTEARAAIQGKERDIIANKNSPLELRCLVNTGQGVHESMAVFWYLNDILLDWTGQTGPGRGARVTEKRGEVFESVLQIDKARLIHSGKFTCGPTLGQADTVTVHVIDGCNGDDDGIPCCDDGFIVGDNDNGAEEMFIQAGDYKSSCLDSCKSLYKNSIGITESLKQKYSSGNGKNKNKCWCEFGNVKLDATNENYQTCVFAVPGSVVSPVAEPLKRPTDHVDERAAFRKSDKDGDGKLTREELVQFYKMTTHDPSVPATYFSVSMMDIFIDSGDENGNKMIDYDEVDWTNDDEYVSEELTKEEKETLARSALKVNDADGNGKLNMEELFKVFNVLFSQGEGVFTRQKTADILYQLDQDGDGQLNFTEFLVPFMEV